MVARLFVGRIKPKVTPRSPVEETVTPLSGAQITGDGTSGGRVSLIATFPKAKSELGPMFIASADPNSRNACLRPTSWARSENALSRSARPLRYCDTSCELGLSGIIRGGNAGARTLVDTDPGGLPARL